MPHGPVIEGLNADSGYILVLNQKANDIRNHIASKYNEDLSNLTNIDIIVLGMVIVPFESREMFPGFVSNETIFRCMMSAIGALPASGCDALCQSKNRPS